MIRSAPQARVGQTFVLGGVGRVAGYCWIPGGFCSLTRTGSRTVRSEQDAAQRSLSTVSKPAITAQESTPASGPPARWC